jgi:hypothetical protein
MFSGQNGGILSDLMQDIMGILLQRSCPKIIEMGDHGDILQMGIMGIPHNAHLLFGWI